MATDAKVSFIERYSQPAASPGSVNLTKRPSIVVGGDDKALAAVQTVLSPRHTGLKMMVVTSPTGSGVRPRGAWRTKLLRSGWTGPADVLLASLAFVLSTRSYARFDAWHTTRTDVVVASLADPVRLPLDRLDCSLYLFVVVNGAVLAMLQYARKKPDVLLEAVYTHAAVLWLRMASLVLLPLAPPADALPVLYQASVFVSSIPTATVLSLLLCVRRHDHAWRLLFAVAALATTVLLLLQRTHHTIDIVAAPCVVHTAHAAVVTMRQAVGGWLASKPEKHRAWTSAKPKPKTL